MSERLPRSCPWSVGSILAVGIVLFETCLVAVNYQHLAITDKTRFFIFYGSLLGAIWIITTGVFGSLAVRVLSSLSRPLGIAVGIGIGAFGLLVIRLHLMLNAANVGMREEAIFTLTGRVGLLGIGASLIGSALIGGLAFVTAKSRFARVRFAWASGIMLASVSVFTFSTRATDYAATDDRLLVAPPPPASPLSYENTNVLLITIDTLRADHLKSHGYSRTTSPRLDELGQRGIRFERAITQRTSTAPALATLLTGTYPPTHRVLNNSQWLQDFNLTMAEMLATRGYYTRAIISNPSLTREFNFHQGFQEYQRTRDLYDVDREELYESRTLNQIILPALDEIKERRFFLWVHYRDPHTPYLVPEDYRDLFTGDDLARAHKGLRVPIGTNPFGAMSTNMVVYGSQELDFLVAQYDAEIKFNDDSLGQVFDKLDEHRLWDNTLVVITADHGESLGEHNYYFGHGATTYEPTAHVPLIWYHPKLQSGLTVQKPVSLVDVLPTILDLLQLPPAPQVQGESFSPLLLGGANESQRPYQFIIGEYRFGYQTHAVTDASHKLVFEVDERWLPLDALVALAGEIWMPSGFFNLYRFRRIVPELYELDDDPGELHNLAGKSTEIESHLSDVLWRWIEETYRQGSDHEMISPGMSDETIKALKALGYL